MSKVFRVTPKRVKKTNGTVLTPEMEVTVTTQQHTTDPFYNGAKEIKDAYMRLYGFDYQKACCSKTILNSRNWISSDEDPPDIIV